MRPSTIPLMLTSFLLSLPASAQQSEKPQATPDTPHINLRQVQGKVTEDPSLPSTLQVLSDTGGADLNKYLQTVLNDVRRNWYAVIPSEARGPQGKEGKVSIDFRILPDGRIEEIKYSAGSGDDALSRAAYHGVTASNPFPPLSSDFKGPYLALRFNVFYNPPKSGVRLNRRQRVP